MLLLDGYRFLSSSLAVELFKIRCVDPGKFFHISVISSWNGGEATRLVRGGGIFSKWSGLIVKVTGGNLLFLVC